MFINRSPLMAVFIFYCILHLPLNINENIHVWQSAQRLIVRTPFQSHEIKIGMEHKLVPVVLLLKCVREWDGNTQVGLV